MRSSAAEHRFGSTPPYTLGIEEEYMLLDPDGLDLVDRVEIFLKATTGGEHEGHVSCELFQSEIEVQTPVCRDVAEAGRELRRLREHVVGEAAAAGVLVASAGTHPFALFERQQVSPGERYRAIIEQVQYPARRELVFGLHVHIGMPSPDAAMRAFAGLRAHIAELVALSASSPFWRGEATGLMSTRNAVFWGFPRSGVPPRFDDYAQFERVVAEIERAGQIPDYTHVWWDIRPHPRFGTLEIRAFDAVPRLDDTLALTAYVQALAKSIVEGDEGQPPHDALIFESKWQAIRRGLGAHVFTAEGARPVTEAVKRTLEQIAAHAEDLGGAAHLAGVERILGMGNSAERQLNVFGADGDIAAVAASLVAESVVADAASA